MFCAVYFAVNSCYVSASYPFRLKPYSACSVFYQFHFASFDCLQALQPQNCHARRCFALFRRPRIYRATRGSFLISLVSKVGNLILSPGCPFAFIEFRYNSDLWFPSAFSPTIFACSQGPVTNQSIKRTLGQRPSAQAIPETYKQPVP